jgi:hypothetical protein
MVAKDSPTKVPVLQHCIAHARIREIRFPGTHRRKTGAIETRAAQRSSFEPRATHVCAIEERAIEPRSIEVVTPQKRTYENHAPQIRHDSRMLLAPLIPEPAAVPAERLLENLKMLLISVIPGPAAHHFITASAW